MEKCTRCGEALSGRATASLGMLFCDRLCALMIVGDEELCEEVNVDELT